MRDMDYYMYNTYSVDTNGDFVVSVREYDTRGETRIMGNRGRNERELRRIIRTIRKVCSEFHDWRKSGSRDGCSISIPTDIMELMRCSVVPMHCDSYREMMDRIAEDETEYPDGSLDAMAEAYRTFHRLDRFLDDLSEGNGGDEWDPVPALIVSMERFMDDMEEEPDIRRSFVDNCMPDYMRYIDSWDETAGTEG